MSAHQPLILIVEDEASIQTMLKLSLENAGFSALTALDTKQAQKLFMSKLPDLILLDWMLPGQSGVEYIKKLRANELTRHIPIILLTAKAEEENKIIGLDSGADDYVTKPFSPRELVTRVKTVLRRGLLQPHHERIVWEAMTIDLASRQVLIKKQAIKLTPKTFELLTFLIKHKNRICTREQLLNHVWGLDSMATDRTVDVHIRRLRQALAPFGYDAHIQTQHSAGYQFTENP